MEVCTWPPKLYLLAIQRRYNFLCRLSFSLVMQANIKLEDLFMGKTVLTLSCKKCSNTVV